MTNDDRDRPISGDSERDERRGGPDEDGPDRRGSTGASESRGASDGAEPHVSVTIEGEYETVVERLDHPRSTRHGELDAIVGNIEETLLAVVETGGGIRSEIYEATGFELNEPWEIRIYLEVLAMHGLVRMQDDEWVPADREDLVGR